MNNPAFQLIDENKHTRHPFLDLGNCGLTTLPDELFTLDWLEGLNFGKYCWDEPNKRWLETENQGVPNKLTSDSLALLNRLTNLKALHLRSNQIQDIRFLKGLPQLQILDISYNQIQNYSILENLTQLQRIDLTYSQISDFSFLQKLPQLQALYLGSNEIQDIRFLNDLPQLQTVDLNDNQLQDFSSLNTFPALQSLFLSYNQIEDVQFLERFPQLLTVDLSDNKIQDIEFLDKLVQLQPQLLSLDISGNLIQQFEPLKKFTHLQSLSLRDSRVQNFDFLEKLPQLQSIDIGDNQIQTIGFLEKLPQLRNVKLDHTEIRDFSTLENLPPITHLNLRSNHIQTIEFLKKFTKLRRLDLRNNEIRKFPKELLERCPDLHALYLHDNPIENIPRDIFDRKSQNVFSLVRDYFTSHKKGTVQNDEVKLIIVGNTTSGKTSLVNFLKERSYNQAENSTHGIKLIRWEIHEADSQVQVNVWDFGGQEYYHATHRLFLDDHAVYLLVWEAATNKQQTIETEIYLSGQKHQLRLEHFPYSYWLNNIRYFAPHSKVLMIQTKIDALAAEPVPDDYFKAPYAVLYPKYDVSVKKANESINQQKAIEWTDFVRFEKQLIQTLQADVARYPLGVKWVEIRDAIRHLPGNEPYMSYATFKTFCQTIDPTVEMDGLLRYLSGASSTIVYFATNTYLKDIVFLNSQWVTSTIYAILSYEIQEQQGEFTREHVQQVLQAKGMESMTDTFLELMKANRFELIFEKPNFSNTYIAPQYLSETFSNPRTLQKLRPSSPVGFTLRFPDFMPRSVFLRFMVQYGNLAEDVYWKNGIVLDKTGVRIVAECLFSAQKITVTLDNKPLAQQLTRELFHVLWQLSDHKSDLELSTNGSDFIEIGQLQRHLQNSRNPEIESKQGNWIAVSEFAHLFGKKIPDIKPATPPINRPVPANNKPAIFFSYAWGETDETREKVVNDLYISLKNSDYNVIRDKVDLGYRKPISDFMERIGRGDFIIVALSDKYLKSSYCMFELYEAFRNSKLEKNSLIERIFPIRTERIDLSPTGRTVYRKHWNRIKAKWDKYVRQYPEDVSSTERAEHEHIKSIVASIGNLFAILNDINALTIELLSQNDFAEIKRAIDERIQSLNQPGS